MEIHPEQPSLSPATSIPSCMLLCFPPFFLSLHFYYFVLLPRRRIEKPYRKFLKIVLNINFALVLTTNFSLALSINLSFSCWNFFRFYVQFVLWTVNFAIFCQSKQQNPVLDTDFPSKFQLDSNINPFYCYGSFRYFILSKIEYRNIKNKVLVKKIFF